MGRVTISSNNLFPGPKGEQGATGPSGGPTGATGPAGPTGPQGVSGPQGLQGTQGNPGAQGASGPIGETGLRGLEGPTGPAGAAGSIGATGAAGGAGATGLTGLTGATGTAGSAGGAGASGLTGATGPASSVAGPTGLTGLTGATGVAGTNGAVGATGVAGTNGATGATGLMANLKKVAAVYYRTLTYANNGVTITHQTMLCTPIVVDRTLTADRLAISTPSAFAGTATIRLGIYSDTNGQPSTLVLDAGTLSVTAASTVYQITISQSLSAGIYWLAFCQQGTAPTVGSYLGMTSVVTSPNAYDLGQTSPTANMTLGYSQASVTGAFPSTMTPVAQGNVPYVWVRFA